METEFNGYPVVDLRTEILKLVMCHVDPDDTGVAIMELLVSDLSNARIAESILKKHHLEGGGI